MHNFTRKLITEWRRLGLPFTGEIVVVAVSGGADSVSLLLALDDLVKRNKLGHRIVAAHFNHRLRSDESEADQEYVRHLTSSLGIELAVGLAGDLTNGNIEQNARTARYQFLAETAKNLHAFAVVTGHTVNDQAETFLINLIRGSGPGGLSGMRPVRELEGEKGRRREEEPKTSKACDKDNSPFLPLSPASLLLVRPLLTWAMRLDTEGFCHDSEVTYRYDTMNEDTAFKRVRIRKILLPLLEDFNPKIIDTLAQTAVMMANVRDGLDKSNASNEHLLIKDLRLLSAVECQATIRGWLIGRRGTARGLDLKHIDAVGRLVLSEKSGRIAELPGGRVIKSGGKLVYKEN